MKTKWTGGSVMPVAITGLALAAASLGPRAVAAQEPTATPFATAVRAPVAPTIDGTLDESFWADVPVIADFRQREPVDGADPTERTEVRIAYDSDNLYFGFVFHDSEPHLIRRSILHREGRIDQDDHVWIVLDSYDDDRNAYIFELNPLGTQGDAHFTDESMTLADWNWEGVYRSEAQITAEGWTLEVAIPFTTIRFAEAEAPEMGIAFRRAIRRKNEDVYWPHIGQEYRGGITTVSRFATLRGLENLRKGRYMELKPFAIGGAQKFGEADTDFIEDLGVDFKYAVTSNLTVDATLKTDFAQVEADNVQINLTRFSLFFPEKREFFLERAGLFTFGRPRETEIFFSRRIGLTNDIIGGGRVTGQAGPVSIGALSLWTDDLDIGEDRIQGANNSVVRLRADVLPRTTVGGIFTSIQNDQGHNRVGGGDTQIRFWNSSEVSGWFANARDSDAGSSSAGEVRVNLRPRRWYGIEGVYQSVEEDFEPGLGFVRRRDQVEKKITASLSPRFEGSGWARSGVVALATQWITGQDGGFQGRQQLLHNMLRFQSGDWVALNIRRREERLDETASIQGRPLDVGHYDFTAFETAFRTNESRTLSGSGNVAFGDFWNGSFASVRGGLTWKTGPYLTLTGSVERSDIELPVEDGDFQTTVLSLDVLGAISRDLFANALVQWDDVSKELQANIRIDWIHTPGSDLFLVLDTGYRTGDLLDPFESRWLRRTGVVKLTYLKAF